MTLVPGLVGVVLAGGASARFGRPKADAQLGGLTLAARAARTLRSVCREVVVGREPELVDLRPGQGPLGGLEAALEWAALRGAGAVAVLACDLPVVHAATMGRLVEAWRRGGSPTDAVCLPTDPMQPLCAVWGVGLRDRVTAALNDGERSVRRFVSERADTVAVPAAELAEEVGLLPGQLLLNVNLSEDLPAARDLVLPPVVTVVGWKDTGKTSVATALVRSLVDGGLDVAAVKHGHGFDVDRPGSDSWRLHHEGGARRVVMAGPDGMALVGRWRERELALAGLVRRHVGDAEVVVAEGWKAGPWPTIEVRGAEPSDRPPLHRSGGETGDRFLAVVAPGASKPGVPARLDRDGADLGDTLAGIVRDRVLGFGE